MAKSVISKNVTVQSTTADRIVWHVTDTNESLYDSDITFTFDNHNGGTFTRTASLNRIEAVHASNGSVTVDGKTYAQGQWDFSELGGIPLDNPVSDTNPLAVTVSTNGNVVVVLRH